MLMAINTLYSVMHRTVPIDNLFYFIYLSMLGLTTPLHRLVNLLIASVFTLHLK